MSPATLRSLKGEKKMTVFEAIDIAENYGEDELTEPENEKRYIQAWQLLIDTGTCWQLQGWFGRTAMMMVDLGHCSLPERK